MEGRRALSECTVLGDASMAWSIVILLGLGFLAGVASTSLFVYLRRRKQLSYEIEYREKCNEGKLPSDPRELILSSPTSLHQRLSLHPTTSLHSDDTTKLNITSTSISPTTTKPPTLWVEKTEEINISTHPLRDSIVYHSSSSSSPSSFKQQQTMIPLYSPATKHTAATTTSDNKEDPTPYGELDDSPLASGRTNFLAAAAAIHASSSSSSQEMHQHVVAISIEAKKNISEAESLEHITLHRFSDDDNTKDTKTDTVVHIPAESDDVKEEQEGATKEREMDDASHSNPFLQSPTEDTKQQSENNKDKEEEIDATSTPHSSSTITTITPEKKKKAAMVSKDKYEVEELGGAGWKEILSQLDSMLHSQGLPPLTADERPVAIRSLVVSTAREDVGVALNKAAADVGLFRKTKQFIKG